MFESPDPRFAVRRARVEDFPRIFELVDTVWERHKPRAAYDWIYLRNPSGIARATVVIERATDRFVSVAVSFPWPVSWGDTPMLGGFGGDAVTLPQFRRQGMWGLRRAHNRLHPMHGKKIGLGAPNAASRAKKENKPDEFQAIGPLPCATLIIDFQSYLASRRVPRAAAGIAGGLANVVADGWLRTLPGSARRLRAEPVRRFDGAFDAVTQRSMRSARYWCPHDARFLNWRYFEHVQNRYQAVALIDEREQPQAYAVYRLDDGQGYLMEFAADGPAPAGRLLQAVSAAARAAGCNRLGFYSTCTWRHWYVMRKAGFVPRPSGTFIDAGCREREDVNVEANWQLVPGDSDVT